MADVHPIGPWMSTGIGNTNRKDQEVVIRFLHPSKVWECETKKANGVRCMASCEIS